MMEEAHIKPCYMLETPKTQGANQATILEDETKVEMDNQQVTQLNLGWLIGIIDGEGYIGITMHSNHPKTHKERKTVKVEIMICNTDLEIIKKYADILTKLGITYHQYQNTQYNLKAKKVWKISVSRMDNCRKLLKIICPYLTGYKKIRGALVLEFLESRISSVQSGLYWIPYSERELKIIGDLLALQKRGTSETIRKAELRYSQMLLDNKYQESLNKIKKMIELKLTGKYNNSEICKLTGYKTRHAVYWAFKKFLNNKLAYQKLGIIPNSDDIVRLHAKA